MKRILLVATISLVLSSCTVSLKKDELKKTLVENPEILTEVINQNPALFMKTLQIAAKKAQREMSLKQKVNQEKEIDAYIASPMKPIITSSSATKGRDDAPITLVEYSDFECPFCSKGNDTIRAFMNKYKGKVKLVYKHLPLSFHPKAMISAQYFEAIRMQNTAKAFKFHDLIFKDQSKLRSGGDKYLLSLAKKVGVNLKRLKKDLNSQSVKEKIAEDQKEAARFGFQGTPGFILNGIPIKGAYPLEYFTQLVTKLEKEGKIKL